MTKQLKVYCPECSELNYVEFDEDGFPKEEYCEECSAYLFQNIDALGEEFIIEEK